MENQVLSIAQMQKLIELGIDVSNASIHWKSDYYDDKSQKWLNHYLGIGYDCKYPYPKGKYIPTFTFQDILDMLPKYIKTKDNTYFLTLLYDSNCVAILYCTEYIKNTLHAEGNKKAINAAFNMLKWCKQNNYLV